MQQRNKTLVISFYLLLVLTLSSCAIIIPEPSGALKWKACQARVSNGQPGDCAVAEVPLVWEDAGSQKIQISVKRLRATTVTKGQLWVLDGGPGGAGWTFEKKDVTSVNLWRAGGWDVYIYSHRGTGDSTRLNCSSDQEGAQVVIDCGQELKAKWGEGLQGFSSYQAAKDLHYLIEELREENLPVSVFGVSYGGYWAQRYMQMYPKQVSSIVLDSPLPLGVDVLEEGLLAEQVILDYYEACSQSASCKAAIGDPKEALSKAQQQLTNTVCPIVQTGLTYESFSELLKLLFYKEETRLLGPAVLARINRCSSSDLEELAVFMEVLEAFMAEQDADREDTGSSDGLQYNVMHLDLTKAINMTELQERYKANILIPADAVSAFNADLWPDFPNYQRNDQQTKAQIPTLILSGGLDIQTPADWHQDVAKNLVLTGGQKIFFPTQGHSISKNGACAAQLTLDFINAPAETLNTSCIKPLSSTDFQGSSDEVKALALEVFGTEKLWGEE